MDSIGSDICNTKLQPTFISMTLRIVFEYQPIAVLECSVSVGMLSDLGPAAAIQAFLPCVLREETKLH